ncbi:MAG: response regulator [Parafilimonas sp.]
MKMPDRFMLIDDDTVNNTLFKFLIKQYYKEISVTMFTEPKAALLAIENEYNKKGKVLSTILFLDINMPVMTGWDFLDIFKDFNVVIREQFTIFVLASYVNYEDEKKAKLNAFVSGCISKPLTIDKITEMVGKVQNVLF